MSYNDIPWVSYGMLKNRSQAMPPYTNTTDTFPLGDRKYSYRHFRVRGDGVFELYLGNREAVDAGLAGQPAKRGGDSQAAKHYASQALIARVYPDNSFEFLSTRGGMSDNLIYNAMIYGASIRQNVKHGGATMYFGKNVYDRNNNAHPLFHGLRVYLSNHSVHPTTDYVTYLPTLKRKEAKEYAAQFDEFHKAWRVLFEPLEVTAYPEIVADLVDEYPETFANLTLADNAYGDPMRIFDPKLLSQTILDLISKKRYADVALASMGYEYMWYLYRYYRHRDKPELVSRAVHYSSTLNRSIAKLVENCMKHTPELFNYRAIESGSPLVATKWGLKVVNLETNQVVDRL